MSLPHVHLFVERDRFGNPHGSGHIRLLRPFTHPTLSDHLRVTSEDTTLAEGTDVVIVERGWRANATLESAADLVRRIRQSGAKYIYTLDDNLLDLHMDEPWREFSTDMKRNIVRYFVRYADCVVVSTKPLKQRLAGLNSNIRVIPNALDERLFFSDAQEPWMARCARSDKIVIGYMGTHSHLEDLMMILEPLRTVLREHTNRVEFQMVGISADPRVCECFDSLPFRALSTDGNHFYTDFVPWAKANLQWDIALAPLADREFNRSKSDIKYLDYALLGIPGIYSRVDAYMESVEHGNTGWLCCNVQKSWYEALVGLLSNQELRVRLAQGAFRRVSETRLLSHCTNEWLNVIQELTGSGARCSLMR